MSKLPLNSFLLIFLFSLFPSFASACAQPGIYSSTTWTTHIASISPQTGIAGVTEVYIRGYCFGTTYGDAPGLGFVSIGGFRVPAANISKSPTGVPEWTDAEIVFTLPFTAVSGDLVVTASTTTGYGSDDSAHETGCPRNNGWPSGSNGYFCGNDMINASFTVISPSNPPFYLPAGSPGCPGSQPCAPAGPPSIPQYVGGTWFYSDGGFTDELVLSQSQNSDGTWTISGTEYPNDRPSGPVTGTLDQSGDLTLAINAGGTCLEYYILGSGDVTSQGYINGSGGGSQYCVPLPGGFLNDYTAWEQSYWYFAAPPLFKSQTDLPASETPTPQDWTALSPTQNPTVGLWERTLVPLPSSANTFAGRFVFEQYGGTAGDSCWLTGSITAKATGVSGGGWYVTQAGDWGKDFVGVWSPGVDWYQAHQPNLPCDITLPQQMNIDGMSGPQPYTTNQLMYEIAATKIYSEVQTQGGSVTFECEYYSNKTVGNRPCKN